MPHNRYYVDQDLCEGEMVALCGDELYHLSRVMRQGVGDEIELANGRGALAKAKIRDVQKKEALARITEVHKEKPYDYSLCLQLALLKPNHLEFAIEKAVELGVTDICLFAAKRSEKKEVSDTYRQRLETIIFSAVKQCGRLFAPTLRVVEKLPVHVGADGISFFGHVDEERKELDQFRDKICALRKVSLCIGPESGFSEEEVALLEKSGAFPIRLHGNILRAETAAISGVCLIHHLLLF